uniref:Integrase, catalytic region, zinc finger, CCHC-type, peptidase aspartic, catalytic n=1 Tax=Tanacetum cinerariifolium TaxID=118510 RepID=A0A6L2NI56_TANCI|nr:hypothetical protein [Tanacetum cinerariifolium]
MYKLDRVTLAPKDNNNMETHICYLKHIMEQAAILREIVKQAKLLNPLDSASYSVCKYVKLIQEFLGYVRDTCPDIYKPSEKLVVVTPINKKKTVRRPKVPKTNGSNSKPKISESMISNKMEPDTSRGSNTSVAPSSSSSVDLRLSRLFCGIWTPDAQIRLNTPVRNNRTDNGTEFLNKTLRSYYESVGISYENLTLAKAA